MNEFYGRNLYFEWDKARVEPEGIGIVIDAWREDLSLSALEVSSLIGKIFEIAGMKVRSSKPGLIANRLVLQLGGLQGCRVFKIAGVRDLIAKYKPDQSFTRNAAKQIIGKNDPATGQPDFSEYEDLFIEGRPWSRKLKPEDAHAYLVKYGLFRVGLEFKCPNCLLDFWCSLDDVRTHTKCEYCGQGFDVTKQLRDRDWRYRRTGLFGKDDAQEGSIPVVLVLQQLDTFFHSHEMLYMTAMEIESESLPIKKCETDFVIVTQKNIDHEVQLAIGECKNRREITDDDVTKLKSVAEALEKIGLRVFVIFAKLTDFTDNELRRCQAINGRYDRRLILLTARELEPYDMYEKTKEEYGIDVISPSR